MAQKLAFYRSHVIVRPDLEIRFFGNGNWPLRGQMFRAKAMGFTFCGEEHGADRDLFRPVLAC